MTRKTAVPRALSARTKSLREASGVGRERAAGRTQADAPETAAAHCGARCDSHDPRRQLRALPCKGVNLQRDSNAAGEQHGRGRVGGEETPTPAGAVDDGKEKTVEWTALTCANVGLIMSRRALKDSSKLMPPPMALAVLVSGIRQQQR